MAAESRDKPAGLAAGGEAHAGADLVVGGHFRTVFVQLTRQATGLVRISEPYAGRGAGDEGGGHAVPVHGLDIFRRRIILPQSKREETGEAWDLVAFFSAQGL